jgi:hypothetical protein
MPASNSESEEDMIIKISYYKAMTGFPYRKVFSQGWVPCSHVFVHVSDNLGFQGFEASTGSQRLLLN